MLAVRRAASLLSSALTNRVSWAMSERRMQLKRSREARIANRLKEALKPSYLRVDDITIGNYSNSNPMFNIVVKSDLFAGLSLLQQHRLVNQALREELKQIHAFNLKTMVPPPQAEEQPEEATQQQVQNTDRQIV